VILLFVLAAVVVFVAYIRMGDEKAKSWLTVRSLDNLKRRMLEIDNLDVVPEEIESRIESVKKQLNEGKGDLVKLRSAMDRLEKGMRSRLTSSQVRQFLDEIAESVEVEIDTGEN
jgi:predicted  nucleic acid-binding Zn-ribbon protein